MKTPLVQIAGMALVHTKLKLEDSCEIQFLRISLNPIVICVKVIFSFRGPNQYVCLYKLESKLGYMALKTTEEEFSLVLSFNADCLAEKRRHLVISVFEPAIQKKQFYMKTELYSSNVDQLIMKDHYYL